MVGAFKPKMLRLTARHADRRNVSSTGPKTYQRRTEPSAEACAEVGRDPALVRRSWCGGCACAPAETAAKRLACPPDEHEVQRNLRLWEGVEQYPPPLEA